MIRSKLRTLLLGGGSAAVMLATALVPATASASPAPEARDAAGAAAGFWSCTVPSGYTYSATQNTLNCGGSGFRTYYFVQPPADNLWACTVSDGFTYSSTQNTLDCSTGGGFRTKYLLRTPKTGLWACTVPSGFTYTSTQSTLDCSTSGGFRTKYLLRAF
ncbi:hypothetical protein [Streptomyces sp. NRRL F-4474]|uniref:hypothetical protein n=1 Tax=Streptomyces sp. NRRL F-4474 TaxID=1463851 RepID=UPI0004C959FF|nr:hypothetical protein [Streptomyces sp. NRRL F-4474]